MTGEHGETGSQMNRGPWAGGQSADRVPSSLHFSLRADPRLCPSLTPFTPSVHSLLPVGRFLVHLTPSVVRPLRGVRRVKWKGTDEPTEGTNRGRKEPGERQEEPTTVSSMDGSK